MFLNKTLTIKQILFVLIGSMALPIESVAQEIGASIGLSRDFVSRSAINRNISRQRIADDSDFLINLTRKFAQDVDPVITFEFNKSELTDRARNVLSSQAAWMRQHPRLIFRVFGHSDQVGGGAYNKELSQRRANAVAAFLIISGVEKNRLQAVTGFGKERPLVFTQEPEEKNRRAITEVAGFVPNEKDGKDPNYHVNVYNRYIGSFEQSTIGNVAQ